MLLEIKNLNKSFDGKQILKDLNLKIDKPETISIVGKSGAGKSTLLKIIASLETMDSGNVLINNKDISSETNKDLGFVFQNFNLFKHLNVKENIELAPKYVLKKNESEIAKKTIELLKLLDIDSKIKSYPSELSGGEQQRVAIARALAKSPAIILFDEPTSALDISSTNSLVKTMNVLKQTNIAMIIVTHDLAFAKKISDRVLLVENSKIVYDSSIQNNYFEGSEILDSLYKEN